MDEIFDSNTIRETIMLIKIQKIKLLILIGLVFILIAVSASPITAQDNVSVPTTEHDAQIANDWMFLLYQLVRDESINAAAAARFYSYAGVGLYEAVVPGMPLNFSIGGQVEGLGVLPFPEEGLEYDYPSVANGSLATLIREMFLESGASEETFARIEAMQEEQRDLRLESVDAEVVERSETLGDEIGMVIGKIFELKKEGSGLTWNDFAILVRANSQADAYVHALCKEFVCPKNRVLSAEGNEQAELLKLFHLLPSLEYIRPTETALSVYQHAFDLRVRLHILL